MKHLPVDKQIFWAALAMVTALLIPIMINPEQGSANMGKIHHFITGNFGALYLWATVAAFGFLIWLAFSKYGNVKFGDPDDKPEFSTGSWLAMLFTAGIGASIMYWSTMEWAYYYTSPPFGAEPKSRQAAEWASTYGIFHWGFSAWALYCIPALPIAYNLYVRKKPNVRLSAACEGVIKNGSSSLAGKAVDVFFMFGLIGGIAAALGTALPMIAAAVSHLFGVSTGVLLDMAIIGVYTIVFVSSAYFGLKKGLKRLCDMNIYLFLALSVLVLVFGPTLFIIARFTDSVGILLQNFFRMSFYMDSVGKSGFPEAWTVFYWAWWIACAPYMGIFVARISRGRTIKQVIVAECLGGTLGCWLAFALFGNTALHFELNKIVPVIDIMEKQGAEAAIVAVFQGLPLGTLALVIFTLITVIFLAATLDSAAYTLASVASRPVEFAQEPARWHRVMWALVLNVVAVSMMYSGGLHALQTVVVLTSFPLIFILALTCISLVRWLREDEARQKQMTFVPQETDDRNKVIEMSS